ncbi:hypothetical protein RFI_40013 [Reticulomyxa filosa]|uniref:Uncharacterized protein n=1 Tax=Reticulomyxa filosa TaxID=46433 RepID=X6L8U3_RETFI|nr:hypothetical protein RFI_40013 [Reticulomyxa filosa]|eukprot:ETN97516.1 hypothetical protein RFI_40013 [Reticulomyxa filosa]
MSDLSALLASTGSQLFAKIGKQLEELQVTEEDLKLMSLAELIEESDLVAFGVKDPFRREFVLKKVEKLIKNNEPSNSKYIKYVFDNTKSDLFVKIGHHLHDLQVGTEDIESIDDLKKFISLEELQAFGITSGFALFFFNIDLKTIYTRTKKIKNTEDKSNFVYKKAFLLITNLKENLPEVKELMNKQPMMFSPSIIVQEAPTKSVPPMLHMRQQSRKFTLSGPIDARSFWRFYFGQQDKVTEGQMEGAIVSLMESVHDETRTSETNVQCVLSAIVSQQQQQPKGHDTMIHKDSFYTFIDSFYRDNVIRSFIQLQDECLFFCKMAFLFVSKKIDLCICNSLEITEN